VAKAQPGDRVLDVCCGTGDLAARFAEIGANVVALDFSVQMLERAVERHASSGRIHCVRADASQLPFRDETFDIVTIGYGLRNLAEWESGVKEMSRVLKPGGRLIVLEFGRPNFAPWRSIYFAYLRLFVPVLGLVFCGNAAAYGYILESLKSYPGQEAVAKKMEALGLTAGNSDILGGAMTITWGTKSGGQNLQRQA
jgi:demethylmenaquinone methyltransferase/2-methoxy-6-polyprenyl-1,4-benzoquinol methylase